MNKPIKPADIRHTRDKLIIVMDLVNKDFAKKYLNQAISLLDDLAEEKEKTKRAS